LTSETTKDVAAKGGKYLMTYNSTDQCDRQTDRQTDGQDVLCLYVVMCVGVKHVRRAATARTVLTSVNAQAVSATRRPASVCVKLADSDRTVVKV